MNQSNQKDRKDKPLKYYSAVTRAFREEMIRNEDVVLIGEDVGESGGIFAQTKGLFSEFGPDRVRDTPIAEAGFTSLAVGAAMTGLRPIVEKRETISATGYAVIDIQRHDNPAQRRLLAIRASKLDAYRNLVEQVYGQYLDSNTTVADMVVKSDTFRSKVEGVIYGARLVSITPVGEDTYEVTLSLDKRTVQDLRVLYLESARLPAADA